MRLRRARQRREAQCCHADPANTPELRAHAGSVPHRKTRSRASRTPHFELRAALSAPRPLGQILPFRGIAEAVSETRALRISRHAHYIRAERSRRSVRGSLPVRPLGGVRSLPTERNDRLQLRDEVRARCGPRFADRCGGRVGCRLWFCTRLGSVFPGWLRFGWRWREQRARRHWCSRGRATCGRLG